MRAMELPEPHPGVHEETRRPPLTRRELLLAAGGPAAIGACIGLKAGLATTAAMAALLPAGFVALGVATLPGLYVASALLGVAPRLGDMIREAVRAQADLSAALLGLTPALLFLIVASDSVDESTVLGSITITLGGLLGVRAFHARLFGEEDDLRALGLFAVWAALCVALGWQLYTRVLMASGGLL